MARLLPLFLILLACSQPQEPLPGRYEHTQPGWLKAGWHYVVNNTLLPTSASLELQEDGTFEFQDCAITKSGTWAADQDSVYLTMETNRWINDSLQAHGNDGSWPTMGIGTEAYYRRPTGGLERIEPLNADSKMRVKLKFERIESP